MSTIKEKMKAVASAIAAIEKQFGKGAIMPLAGGDVAEIAVVPTGSVGLDLALGVGGCRAGASSRSTAPSRRARRRSRCTPSRRRSARAACAPSSTPSTRSTSATRASSACAPRSSSSRSPTTASRRSRSPTSSWRTGAIDLIVVDSVAALVPKAEIEGEMGDAHMGLQARLMSQALRKLTAATARNNTAVIFINQLRQKIGVVFGNPETTTGGNALKFYASVRLDIRKIGVVKNGDVVMGTKTRVKVVKNKMAPPFREAEFEILYGTGVNWAGEIVDLGSEAGVIEKSGAYYSLEGRPHRPGPRERLPVDAGEPEGRPGDPDAARRAAQGRERGARVGVRVERRPERGGGVSLPCPCLSRLRWRERRRRGR